MRFLYMPLSLQYDSNLPKNSPLRVVRNQSLYCFTESCVNLGNVFDGKGFATYMGGLSVHAESINSEEE